MSINTSGFTLVELLIVISVTGILTSLLFGPLSDLYTSNANSIKSTAQTGDMRSALRAIEGNVTLAKAFLTTDEVDDPRGPNNNTTDKWNWQGLGANNPNARVLIISSFATTSARELIYLGAGCDEAMVNNMVYFVRDNTLYRRTIVNRTTPTCGGAVAQRQSCAPTVTHSSCQAIDAKLLGDVARFSINYYTSSGVSLSTPAGAQAIVATISVDSPTDTVPASTGNLRMALINEEATP